MVFKFLSRQAVSFQPSAFSSNSRMFASRWEENATLTDALYVVGAPLARKLTADR
jgi:hypothetical protein